MKTDHQLAATLKDLMCKIPLEEISVSTLTNKCHINRQTFYYHFHDIYDLLTLVYLDEKIEGLDSVNSLSDLLEVFFKYYSKNSIFIDASLNSAGKELVQEFFYNNAYQTILRLIVLNPLSNNIEINDRKNVARFYALGIAYSTIYYLDNFKSKSLEGLKSSLSFISDKSINDSLKKILEGK